VEAIQIAEEYLSSLGTKGVLNEVEPNKTFGLHPVRLTPA
jgi:hypothetical protein